jgi:hypothetical protein
MDAGVAGALRCATTRGTGLGALAAGGATTGAGWLGGGDAGRNGVAD